MLILETQNRPGMHFPRQQYRSEIATISDILVVTLEYGRDGVIGSAISRRANLSHHSMLQKCRKLMNAGMMEFLKVEKSSIYRVTDRGIWFLEELKRFQALIKEVNVRL